MKHERPIRVLEIIDSLGMGGAETWLIALLRHWRDAGPGAPQIEVLATSGRAGSPDGAHVAFLLPLAKIWPGARGVRPRAEVAASLDAGLIGAWTRAARRPTPRGTRRCRCCGSSAVGKRFWRRQNTMASARIDSPVLTRS